MGNSGSVGVVFSGVDWNDEGLGVTVACFRLGISSGRGLEVGLGTQLGFQIDGKGFGGSARAIVGIGGAAGISAGAGAQATLANTNVGAAAGAGMCTESEACYGTCDVQKYEAEVKTFKIRLSGLEHVVRTTEEKLRSVEKIKEKQQKKVDTAKYKVRKLEDEKRAVGKERTMAEDSLCRARMSLSEAKHLFDAYEHELDFLKEIGDDGTDQAIVAENGFFQKIVIVKVQAQISKLESSSKRCHEQLLQAQRNVVAEDIKMEQCQLDLILAQEKNDVAQQELRTARAAVKSAQCSLQSAQFRTQEEQKYTDYIRRLS